MKTVKAFPLLLGLFTLIACGESDKDDTNTVDETVTTVSTNSGATTVAATEVSLDSLLKAITTTIGSVRSKDANLLRGGGNQSGAADPTTSDSDDPYCDTSGNPISAVAENNTSTTSNSRKVLSASSNLYPAGHAYCLFSPSEKVAQSILETHRTIAVLVCLLGNNVSYDGKQATKTILYSAENKACFGSAYSSSNDGQYYNLTYTATKIADPLDTAAKGGFNHKIDIALSINTTPVMTTSVAYKTRSDSLMFGAYTQNEGQDKGDAYLFSFDPSAGTLFYEYYQPTITITGSYGASEHVRAKVDGKWDLTNGFTEVSGFSLLSSYYYDFSESLKNTPVDASITRTSAFGYIRSIAGDFKSGLISRNYLVSCIHGSTCEPNKKSSYRDLTGTTGHCVIQNNIYQCPNTPGIPLTSDSETDFLTFGTSVQSAKAWFASITAPLSFATIKPSALPTP